MLIKINTTAKTQYHANLLSVKVRPVASLGPAAMSATAPMAAVATTPGFAMLAAYERAGLIKQVIPLSDAGPAPRRPAGRGFSAVAALTASRSEEAPVSSALAGTSIIELEEGADMSHMQVALASDPNIDEVSRVPVRYLMAGARPKSTRRAGKKGGRKSRSAGGSTIAAIPPPASTMWNLTKIKWQQAIEDLGTADDVHVAVLDTGIDLDHPDLPGDEITYVYDYPDSPVATSEQDVVGHGTHVAGTIRAVMNNDVGVNGICACQLSAYKIFTDETYYVDSEEYFAYLVDPVLYLRALDACLQEDVDVINLSIGGFGAPSTAEKDLFEALIENGTIIVAAMGNENTSQKSYPAAIPGVIAVAATKANDVRAGFSNYGKHVAVSAPGVGIWSTLPTYPGQTGFWPSNGSGGTIIRGEPIVRETDYDGWEGTSMASPHVAAAAALALAKYGETYPSDMKTLLMGAVDKVSGMQGQNFSKYYGAGRLNLTKI